MMDRRKICVSLGAMTIAAMARPGVALAAKSAWPIPPQQPVQPREVGNFGHKRIDNYAWMRPKDWHAVLRDPTTLDPPIRAAIDAETAYADAMLAPSQPLQAALLQRAEAVGNSATSPLEVEDGGYLYYQRAAPGSEYPVYARKPKAGGAEQILLDAGAQAKGKTFYGLHWAGPFHSPDQKMFGWAEDLTGSGIFSIRVREIATGKMRVTDIDAGHGSFAFDAGGRYLFWVGRDDSGHPNSVWRRDMQTGADVKVHAESDPAFFIQLRTTASGGFVVIQMLNGAQTEVMLVPASDPTAKPILVEPRAPDLRYDVDHWNDQLVILTDVDGAIDMKIMTVPVATPGRAQWKPWVPHIAGRFIAAIHPFRDHLVREEWRDANPRLVVMDKKGGERDVGFDEPAYALFAPHGQGWDAPALAFTYQSPRTPPQPSRLMLASGTAAPARATTINPAYDPAHYVVERLEAVAPDGERVPITLLRSKAARRDGKAPLFLYGYGSYGATVPAEFDAASIALVDQGWSYAIAHVRGGAEKGSHWWRSVLKTGKKKTFTDFIACAEHLIAEGYTAKGRIVSHGYSAGGLLMGAIYTMRPDLWAGVIAQVPFVDPLNTMDAFETHPLGLTALPIWGDPRVPEEYAYIASYSPYDQLKPAAYPALLTTSSLADERVAFYEPLKFTVRARAVTTGGHPIMTKISSIGGHMGASGSKAVRQQQAMFQAFAIWAADDKWGIVPQR
ncbi:S9 family peptidase [Sphingobium boeckii]|uniref:Oligopeptidase B n=1 Tax=Sphingobium boeckii TaxID=1082345 RepID=A0A7W9AJM9_9SPHN|nr:prolyl oligopeptidase family serine peptidase [Sphingobium boeckii]MBB5686880.1 oligopeptidase B [Sphingobium boeckii]